jgi:hypothetical protein
LKNNYLPEMEKIHKKKERLLKKQQREALLLDNRLTVNGFTSVRSRRERKRVTYTFGKLEPDAFEGKTDIGRILDHICSVPWFFCLERQYYTSFTCFIEIIALNSSFWFSGITQ